MPRNLSFSATWKQFQEGEKDVTRRLGWRFLNGGEELMGVEKGQGIKKGELNRGGLILVTGRRFERLNRLIRDPEYGEQEVIREGFPGMTPAEFVEFFCDKMGCEPDAEITRITFKHMTSRIASKQKLWRANLSVNLFPLEEESL